jgi:hypothetical protein
MRFEVLMAMRDGIIQGCTNPGCQVTVVVKHCVVASNIYWSCVRNFLFVTLLAPRILRGFPNYWKTCRPLRF